MFFIALHGDTRTRHLLQYSFPSRRSSDLLLVPRQRGEFRPGRVWLPSVADPVPTQVGGSPGGTGNGSDSPKESVMARPFGFPSVAALEVGQSTVLQGDRKSTRLNSSH